MRSALYRGRVQHRRSLPKPHEFDYPLHLLYLDLAELPKAFRGRWLWSAERWNLFCFRRSDYFGNARENLRTSLLDRVESELGRRPAGHVGVLTQVRTLGYLFNPVSFYLCHDETGNLDAIVAEITNTPWGERHAYVLDAAKARGADGRCHFEFEKRFHVSPFFPMEQTYLWSFRWTGDRVEVGMLNREAGETVFGASLVCEREELSARRLALAALRFPLQPLRLHFAIYWQALRLYVKRTPVFTHPKKRLPVGQAPQA